VEVIRLVAAEVVAIPAVVEVAVAILAAAVAAVTVEVQLAAVAARNLNSRKIRKKWGTR
jgi:hypothetical protein